MLVLYNIQKKQYLIRIFLMVLPLAGFVFLYIYCLFLLVYLMFCLLVVCDVVLLNF